MKRPNDDKPRFNYPAIVAGAFLAIYGLVAICTGSLTVVHRRAVSGTINSTLSVAQDPHRFWFMVAVIFGISALCLFFGFSGRK